MAEKNKLGVVYTGTRLLAGEMYHWFWAFPGIFFHNKKSIARLTFVQCIQIQKQDVLGSLVENRH